MSTLLHLLRNEPDDAVAEIIVEANQGTAALVTCLYPDVISQIPVDWDRLVADIFAYDYVICW